MEGNGYIGDKTMGVNIHSALAVTPEGLVLGVLDQMGFNRAERKNTALTVEQKKNRPREEKESNRRLETMEHADRDRGGDIKILHVCDREGDSYELFDKALQTKLDPENRIIHGSPRAYTVFGARSKWF
jgi:hypothetical protein